MINSNDPSRSNNNAPSSEPQANQYAEARKALQSIGNSKSHKNQALSSGVKESGRPQKDEVRLFNKAAEEGNFAKLISVLASQKTEEERQCLMNEARRRLQNGEEDLEIQKEEVDAITKRMPIQVFLENKNITSSNAAVTSSRGKNGYYDLTPLASAALRGRSNVVEYLLRQGADPTLRGSPSNEEDYNALEAAKQGVKASQKEIDSVLSTVGKDDTNNAAKELIKCFYEGEDSLASALALAQSLVKKREQNLLCLALLESVEPFWPRAQSYSSHYRKRNYNNRPTDMKALRAALDAIALEGSTSRSMIASRAAVKNELLVNRLAGKIAALQTGDSLPKKKRMSGLRKIKNKGRRYSDSFCIPPPPRDALAAGNC